VTAEGRTLFKGTFQRANSLDSSDIPTLIAMGGALRAWGDAELVEMLLRALGKPSTVVRAELVLQAAGVGVDWNRTPEAKGVYSEWWNRKKDSFTKRRKAAGGKGWQNLRPQYIPAPLDMSKFDPADKKWRDEMELDRLQLGSFGFGMAIDCSRSMRPEIDRLKRDMRIMFAAFQMIAREVGVGVTKFAPGEMVKCLPLTGDVGKLMAYVNAADIMGPAGEEEWAGALKVTIEASHWPRPGKYSRRAIVLLSDEPITDPQFARASRIVADAAKQGFRIYGVKIRALQDPPKNPLSVPFDRTTGGSVFAEDGLAGKAGRGGKRQGKAGSSWAYYDELAKAAGGRAIDVYVPQGGVGLGVIPRPSPKPAAKKANAGGGNQGGVNRPKGGGRKKPGVGRRGPAGPAGAGGQVGGGKAGGGKAGANFGGMDIAPVYPGGGPTSRVLTLVLTDAINPYHASRIEPLVKILVAYCQKAAPRVPERRTWSPPGRMERNRPAGRRGQ
jgi:hypothetical protein